MLRVSELSVIVDIDPPPDLSPSLSIDRRLVFPDEFLDIPPLIKPQLPTVSTDSSTSERLLAGEPTVR